MKFERYRNRVSLIWGTADARNLRNYYLNRQISANRLQMKKESKDKERKEKELNEG